MLTLLKSILDSDSDAITLNPFSINAHHAKLIVFIVGGGHYGEAIEFSKWKSDLIYGATDYPNGSDFLDMLKGIA